LSGNIPVPKQELDADLTRQPSQECFSPRTSPELSSGTSVSAGAYAGPSGYGGSNAYAGPGAYGVPNASAGPSRSSSGKGKSRLQQSAEYARETKPQTQRASSRRLQQSNSGDKPAQSEISRASDARSPYLLTDEFNLDQHVPNELKGLILSLDDITICRTAEGKKM